MSLNLFLILGGAFSGKTKRAAEVASAYSCVNWIGTAVETLPELSDHIQTLRADRPAHWTHTSAPFDLPDALRAAADRPPTDVIVIDSISQWISNQVARSAPRHDEQQICSLIDRDTEELCDILRQTTELKKIVVVSSDFGQSLPPQDSLQKILRRSLGLANTKLAALSKNMELLTAGVVVFAK
jgi:adenosylcobinamide kinase/adenosylcobinamide-phosphate guanylyltransferase